MSFATVADVTVQTGEIKLSLFGAWTARCSVVTSDPSEVTGAVDLVVGKTTLKGQSVAEVDEGNRVTLRITGGAGGFGTVGEGQSYNKATRRQIVQDALALGGEKLSSDSDSELLDTIEDQWVRAYGNASHALWALVEAVGETSWRVLTDGTVWVGKETWPAVSTDLDYVVESEEPAESRFLIAIEDVGVLPGQTFKEKQVSEVTYTIDESSCRAQVYYGTARGEWQAFLGVIIEDETYDTLYRGLYSARAITQNSDGTLELRPNDIRIPPMSKVKVRPGVPGLVAYQLVPNSEVVMTFEDGSPRRPVVTNFATGDTLASLTYGQQSTADALVQDLKMKAYLNQVVAAFASHVHSGGTIGGSTGAPASPLPSPGDLSTAILKGG